ncbi:unnamed protein product [Spirodela intermedia]|uniref:Uncharacterized protein n=1 Tax=Spirodela intermedia TaxID=51605 RepID=A0ABN7E995_SPIIN|nr:unnamed protein product [Spirodela intermedia]
MKVFCGGPFESFFPSFDHSRRRSSPDRRPSRLPSGEASKDMLPSSFTRLAGKANFLLLVSSLFLFISVFILILPRPSPCPSPGFLSDTLPLRHTGGVGDGSGAAPTAVRHLVFGLASSARSFPHRRRYIRSWWDTSRMRGFVFLDSPFPEPPIRISADVSGLPYTFPGGGLRSAVRVARVARELVGAAEGMEGVRWVVLGDDDTVFFPENLAATLRRHDWEQWHYVGSSSEAVVQNEKYSFDMAFGGGGFALSWPLARALARVLDSCLVRYAHLYGSDARIFSCLAELGVDLRGDIFGMLTAHPLTPLVSLHHLDNVEPIFPGMDRVQALEHLFTAVAADPGRILQQTVCYDRLALQTVSISWGYAVQVFSGNHFFLTFLPGRRHLCHGKEAVVLLPVIICSTRGHFPRIPLVAPRRHCCDILPSSGEVMEIKIRECGDELIAMLPWWEIDNIFSELQKHARKVRRL